MKRLVLIASLFVLVLMPLISHGLTLSWVGCGITKKAFMAELAIAYEAKTGISFDISGGGATKGIKSVVERQSDMGGSCRFKIKGETKGSTVKFNPVAWDALVVIVHKDNPIDSIDLNQLRALYLGEVSNWNQLGGADRPVQLLVRKGKISGVGLTIRQLIFGDDKMVFPQNNLFKSSGPLEKAVETNRDAISMSGISSARKRDFKIIKLDKKEPSFKNIKSGEYLLYRPLYLVTDRTSENYSEVSKFLAYCHSKEGRDIIKKNGVVPYLEAPRLILKQREQWKNSRTAEL